MKDIQFNIEGMHCAGCSNRLERVLNNLEGIDSVSVSLENKAAKICYNETKITLKEIKKSIIDSGFEVKGE